MTYLDFLAQIRRELEEPSEGVWADASILVWTNQAVRDFAKRTHVERDEVYATTTIGEHLYEMPEYTLEPVQVFYDNLPLQRVDIDQFSTLAESSGTPSYWAATNTALMLWPVPDSEGTIRYFRYRYPDPIESDDDMPFAGEYDDALAYYVKAKATEQINDWQSAGELRRMYYEATDMVMGQQNMERQGAMTSTSPREVY